MNGDPKNGERPPVVPPRDPSKKPKQISVYLPKYIWDRLDEIARVSGEYTRNEIIQLFLENRIAAWLDEQTRKNTKK